jgi:hypothetical protein
MASFRTNLADRLAPAKTRIASRVGELIAYTNRYSTIHIYAHIGPEEKTSKEVLGTDADETSRTFTIPRQTVSTGGVELRVPGMIWGFEIGDVIDFEDARWSVTGVGNPDSKRITWEVRCVRSHARRVK